MCICEWVCFLPFWPQLYPDGPRAQCAKLTETRQRHSPGVSELEEHCGLTHNNTDPQESHPIKCPPLLHCTGARVFIDYIKYDITLVCSNYWTLNTTKVTSWLDCGNYWFNRVKPTGCSLNTHLFCVTTIMTLVGCIELHVRFSSSLCFHVNLIKY